MYRNFYSHTTILRSHLFSYFRKMFVAHIRCPERTYMRHHKIFNIQCTQISKLFIRTNPFFFVYRNIAICSVHKTFRVFDFTETAIVCNCISKWSRICSSNNLHSHFSSRHNIFFQLRLNCCFYYACSLKCRLRIFQAVFPSRPIFRSL